VRPTEDQKEAKEGEEKLTLKRGAFVLIQGGEEQGPIWRGGGSRP